MKAIVVKLGGSLLHQAGWVQALQHRLNHLSFDRVLLIVGGGEAIEAMRDLDRMHSLDLVAMHWRCISMLTATYEIACEMISRSLETCGSTSNDASRRRLGLDSSIQIRQWLSSTKPIDRDDLFDRIRIVDIGSVYRESYDVDDQVTTSRQTRLPENWRTTTDSLAIWLARTFDIPEVLLLKSCEIPTGLDLSAARQMGIVDDAVEILYDPNQMRCHIERLKLM